jgi:hypothetical protein
METNFRYLSPLMAFTLNQNNLVDPPRTLFP